MNTPQPNVVAQESTRNSDEASPLKSETQHPSAVSQRPEPEDERMDGTPMTEQETSSRGIGTTDENGQGMTDIKQDILRPDLRADDRGQQDQDEGDESETSGDDNDEDNEDRQEHEDEDEEEEGEDEDEDEDDEDEDGDDDDDDDNKSVDLADDDEELVFLHQTGPIDAKKEPQPSASHQITASDGKDVERIDGMDVDVATEHAQNGTINSAEHSDHKPPGTNQAVDGQYATSQSGKPEGQTAAGLSGHATSAILASAATTGSTVPVPGDADNHPPINQLQPKKKRAALTTTAPAQNKRSPSPPAIPKPLVEMQTIRLSFSLVDEDSNSTPDGSGGSKVTAKILSFKDEAVEQGLVEKGYWEALLGIRPVDEDEGDGDDQGEEDGMQKSTEATDGDVDMDKAAVPRSKPPMSSLAALMAAVGDGPGDNMADAERLAKEFDAKYEEANPGAPGAGTSASGSGSGPVRQRKKRGKEKNEYDTKDPFVDDSELMVDEPMYYHQPKRPGFYVAQGDVELCGVLEDQ